MDFDDDGNIRRISPRLRNALVADLVVSSEPEVGNGHLRWDGRDPYEWTAHLARQLGMGDRYYLREDVHDTLMVVIGELDRVLRTPTLLRTTTEPGVIADAATRYLHAGEAKRMLLLGPEPWLRAAESAQPSELRAAANRALSAALARMFRQWDEWQVIGLAARWREAQAEAKAEAAREQAERLRQGAAAVRPRRVGGKLIPPPPPIVEGAAAKAGRIRERGSILPSFEPPPWESER